MTTPTHKTGIGVITPSGNIALELELPRLGKDRVRWHFTRVENYRDTEDELAAMAHRAPEAARLLGHATVAGIVFACTGGSLLRGRDYDLSLVAAIEGAAAVPAITTSSAILLALRALEAKSVALFTPYHRWLTDRAATYLEQEGIRVDLRRSLEVPDARHIGHVSGQHLLDWIGTTPLDKGTDAVVISCTALHTFDVIEPLEEVLQRPVVTSNQATAWGACQLVLPPPSFEGPGRLFHTVHPTAA